jgi:hypothetical protein
MLGYKRTVEVFYEGKWLTVTGFYTLPMCVPVGDEPFLSNFRVEEIRSREGVVIDPESIRKPDILVSLCIHECEGE